jgi:uncharacterized protein YcbK (DUF882 family)
MSTSHSHPDAVRQSRSNLTQFAMSLLCWKTEMLGFDHNFRARGTGTWFFLVFLLVCASSFNVPKVNASPGIQSLPEYRLQLYNTHTGQRVDIVYRRGNEYISSSLAKLDYFLRDHRTGDVAHFDPRLYDLLEKLTNAVGRSGGQIDVVCGYRTPWSNNFLRTHTQGVARHSLHMLAEAIDIRMPGVDTYRLRRAALALHAGGVGYYPHSNFIHVDVGPVRRWCFECTAKQMVGN